MIANISSLADLESFQDTVEPDKVVFRGQGSANWGLVPSMHRGLEKLSLDGWEAYICDRERDIFRDFHDRSKRFWRGGSPWDTLVMAQHYGTPTRLVDWTPNALAALYFACASSPSEDGAIWCANPSKLPMPDYLGRIHDDQGFRKERLAKYIPEWELPFCQPFSKPALPPGAPPGSPRPAFDQNGEPELSGILTFFLPEHIDSRITAQLGLFSVYICEHSSDEIVIDHASYIRTVEKHFGIHILDKLTIPASAKGKLLQKLHRVGIDARSVYPDMQGLGIYYTEEQRRLAAKIHP